MITFGQLIMRIMWQLIKIIHSKWQYHVSRNLWRPKSNVIPELSGQHCLGPVLVRFLSGFSGKFCLVSVRCPDFVRIRCPVSVCPDFVCRVFVRCPDSVRIPMIFFVRCLSVRIFSVVFLSGVRILSGFSKKICPVSVCPDFLEIFVCPVFVRIFFQFLKKLIVDYYL